MANAADIDHGVHEMVAMKRARGRHGNRTSVRDRILQFFFENLGKVVTREAIIEAATDPVTGREPENWHQRLSELRTDHGYTILSNRDRHDLRPGQYLMPHADRRPAAAKRIGPTKETWKAVLQRADDACEWSDAGVRCGLGNGDIDPIGGGTVKLTADHVTPHAVKPDADPSDPTAWQALCGRHQVVKKNFWDQGSGKLNVYAIVQAAGVEEKRRVYEFLKVYFGDDG